MACERRGSLQAGALRLAKSLQVSEARIRILDLGPRRVGSQGNARESCQGKGTEGTGGTGVETAALAELPG